MNKKDKKNSIKENSNNKKMHNFKNFWKNSKEKLHYLSRDKNNSFKILSSLKIIKNYKY